MSLRFRKVSLPFADRAAAAAVAGAETASVGAVCLIKQAEYKRKNNDDGCADKDIEYIHVTISFPGHRNVPVCPIP